MRLSKHHPGQDAVRRSGHCIARIAALLLLAAWPRVSVAVSFDLTRVVDTSMSAPGTTGNFWVLEAPKFDAGQIVFSATDQGVNNGLYAWADGQLTTIVDVNTPQPGTSVNFASLGKFDLSDGHVVFFAQGEKPVGGDRARGIYSNRNGIIELVAGLDTPIPGGTGNFESFGSQDVAIDGQTVAFTGTGSSFQNGLYLDDNTTKTVVVDRNTTVPGQAQTFVGTGPIAMDDGQVVFRGWTSGDTIEGIYRSSTSGLETIADVTMAVPGGVGTFTSFGSMDVDAGDIGFRAEDGNGEAGVYLLHGGTLRRIAGTGDAIPGTEDVFGITISAPAVRNGQLVFTARTDDDQWNTSIFHYDINGSLSRVIGTGDVLDGQTISDVTIREGGMDEGAFAFSVSFDDGSQAIYRSPPIPLPGAAFAGARLLAVLGVTRSLRIRG